MGAQNSERALLVSIHVNGEVARALLPNCVNRVRASGGTIRLMFNVGAVTKEVGVGGDGGGRLMIFHGPLHLGAVNVPAIKGASSLLRGRDGVFEAGNRYRRQQADDGYNDHDFDECESSPLFCVHVVPDLLWFASSLATRVDVRAVDDKVLILELCCGEKVSSHPHSPLHPSWGSYLLRRPGINHQTTQPTPIV